jgi:hypothetical protein
LSNPEIQNLLQTGIEAARSGNRAAARMILGQVVERDPRNELGWMWLASVAETAAERRTYLQKVLEINPANERAKQALVRLEQTLTPAPEARPSEAPRPDIRITPVIQAPVAPPIERTISELPREALLDVPAPRRRSSPLFIVAVVLALALIGTGFYLLYDYTVNPPEDETPVPSTTLVLELPTQESGFSTSTPVGGIFVTLPPVTVYPTWAPSPTSLPTETPEVVPTATPTSPEFQLVVSVRPGGGENWELEVMAEGQMIVPRLQLNNPALTLLETYDAAFSPDGQQIAFTARITRASGDPYEEIGIVDVEGGSIALITTLLASNTDGVCWSPDGTQIAFESNTDGDYDIYVMNANGGAPENLTSDNAGPDRDPTWSPDGEFLAFASDRESPGFLDVYRMGVDGSDAVRLTQNANSFAPAWSPDGSMIAFISNRNQDNDLFLMNADGTNEHVLTASDGIAEDRDPTWTPDGRLITFSSNRDSGEFDIYAIQPSGAGVRQITSHLGHTRYPNWQPHE